MGRPKTGNVGPKYQKQIDREQRLRAERDKRPYRTNEALCRQLVAQGNYAAAPAFRPVKQGAFTPGSPTTYAVIRLICCRERAPVQVRPYSVHDAVIVDRAEGPEVHLIRGSFDLTREMAEELL